MRGVGVGDVNGINPLKTNVFGYLRVGVLAVEELRVVCARTALHTVNHLTVREFYRAVKVLLVAKNLVGVGEGLIDATVLPSEDVLHLRIVKF